MQPDLDPSPSPVQKKKKKKKYWKEMYQMHPKNQLSLSCWWDYK